MKKIELVFLPIPGLSHIISTVEAGKLLLNLDARLSMTVLIMQPFSAVSGKAVADYIQKISSNPQTTSHPRFINLSTDDNPKPSLQSKTFLADFINSHIDSVTSVVSDLINQQNSQIAGLVLDMFCTQFIEVGNKFNLPSYVFFTSGAATLGLFNDAVSLKFEHNKSLKQYRDSDSELSVKTFSKSLPAKVLPSVMVDGSPAGDVFLDYFRRIKDAKGIMVNTFYELETYAIQSLISSDSPKIYPIGPILHLESSSSESETEIIQWLDNQPDESVVFLCFGTMGSFDEDQVREIAKGLESSGYRFLWSLRKPQKDGSTPFPVEYDNLDEVFPEGFLDRTKGVGKIIGWAPQVAVLSHAAVGGFVSHCGWNSTLESIWHGVPIATFPMYAEQQLNAFLLVKELGIAEMIRIDYFKGFKEEDPTLEIVPVEEIEAAVRRLMVAEGGVRGKVKELKEKSRKALEEGGSSYEAQIMFIEDVTKNIE